MTPARDSHLTPQAKAVLRGGATEAPGTSPLLKEDRSGVFRCAGCNNALFASDAKFESGTGWPSFDQAIPGAVTEIADTTFGMRRVEIVCTKCKGHLGHVFDDGPTSTGLRYCTNGCALERAEGAIVFKNVTFAYNERPVIHDVNLRVEPRQTVAIVGATGSGKSTLFQLLTRFYDPQKGEIDIDAVQTEIDQLETELAEVREKMAELLKGIKR